MEFKWRRLATTLGLVGCLAMLAPACVIRARARVQPVFVADTQPPPPQYQTVQPRAGHVWIRGHHEYRGNRWVWQRGHWERARTGYVWQEGRWVRRGNRWHWKRGRWVAGRAAPPARVVPGAPAPRVRDHRAGAHPMRPPPAPRAANPGVRAGYVWIPGHYRWRAGNYVWVKGHWERARRGKHWERGRWVKRGGHYVWVKGRWAAGPRRDRVRDHRRRR